MSLLTTGNPKTAKGESAGYLTAILHLAPWKLSGKNVCPNASPECIRFCLNTAGRGGIIKRGEDTNAIQRARIRKTDLFFTDRDGFFATLRKEIRAHVARAKRNGLRPAVRLNGTSDIAFERLQRNLFTDFPEVTFYDYTKSFARMSEYLAGGFPSNYSLTFSRSEVNATETATVLENGGNVAIVFETRRGEQLPWDYSPNGTSRNFTVIDGDKTDLRFTDPRGIIVGLRAKGKARSARVGYSSSGFVVSANV